MYPLPQAISPPPMVARHTGKRPASGGQFESHSLLERLYSRASGVSAARSTLSSWLAALAAGVGVGLASFGIHAATGALQVGQARAFVFAPRAGVRRGARAHSS